MMRKIDKEKHKAHLHEMIDRDTGRKASPSSPCSLIETVAWCMAIANARGRFNDVADSPEKEAIIKLEAERNQKKWEAAARMQLNINGHI